jgi:heme exporter protein C
MKSIWPLLAIAAVSLLAFSTYQALYVAPPDALQGEVGRIIYYHVPCAWVGGLCFFFNFCASIWYLMSRNPRADAFALASAEVGVVFNSIVLLTGPIWARPVWGIWWTWDARLSSTLVLWLIYVSYLILRHFVAGGQSQTIAAVLAVFGFADVPLVYYSIQWFRTQHPQPVFGGGEARMEIHMLHAFLWNMLAFTVMGLLLVWARFRIALLQQQVEEAHKSAELGVSAAESF